MPRSNRVDHIYELIGNTPVVRLNRVVPEGAATVFVKLESANPGGSIKDRIALNIIEDAEQRGVLKSGQVILESTSGNTGVGLALVAAAKGYGVAIVMPDTMTLERQSLLKAYGAEVILTPGSEGMKGAVDKAEAMAKGDPKYFLAYQFENPANPEAHRRTTALEILEQVPELDAFVAGVGTGGTLTGVGEVLAERKPGTLVVAVEPESSPLLSKGQAGPNRIQGIGANFIPKVLNREVYQRVAAVSYADAIAMARRLTREEALFSGISTGAIVHAAVGLAVELGKGRTVVAVLCDTGERYLSHPLYAEIDAPGA